MWLCHIRIKARTCYIKLIALAALFNKGSILIKREHCCRLKCWKLIVHITTRFKFLSLKLDCLSILNLDTFNVFSHETIFSIHDIVLIFYSS